MFGNTNATGYDVDPFPSDPETRCKYHKIADAMSRMWISFAVTRTPNFHGEFILTFLNSRFWPRQGHALI